MHVSHSCWLLVNVQGGATQSPNVQGEPRELSQFVCSGRQHVQDTKSQAGAMSWIVCSNLSRRKQTGDFVASCMFKSRMSRVLLCIVCSGLSR